MAIFFIIVFTVYFLTNLTCISRAAGPCRAQDYHTTTYTVVFLVLASTFIAGKFLEHRYHECLYRYPECHWRILDGLHALRFPHLAYG